MPGPLLAPGDVKGGTQTSGGQELGGWLKKEQLSQAWLLSTLDP